MGHEYNINFDFDEIEKVEYLLKSLPYFQAIEHYQDKQHFIYRLPQNSGAIPSGLALIEIGGIYFCNNGGGNEVLKEMMYRIALSYKRIEFIDHNE